MLGGQDACKHYGLSPMRLDSNITRITYLHYILMHANITRLGAGQGTGSLDGLPEGMRIGKVDPALLVQFIGGTQ